MKDVSGRAKRAQTTMSFAFPTPDHMPCPECGASVPVADGTPAHTCDEARLVDYGLIELRPEIERFPDDLAAWLDTPAGRFAQWLARRDR